MFVDRPARRRLLATRVPAILALACAAGLIFAVPALAKTDAEIEAETAPPVAGTPCTAAARACIDVNKKHAWLIKDGKIFRGPVLISTGGSGKDTPTGNVFRVYRKDKEFKSTEFKLPNGQPAPMPNAVFFEDGGIAFHAGNPKLASAGCVHLSGPDALAFFSFLEVGDHVQVMDGPVAAKPLTAEQIEAANANSADHSDSDGESDEDSDSRNSDSRDSDSDSGEHSDRHSSSDRHSADQERYKQEQDRRPRNRYFYRNDN